MKISRESPEIRLSRAICEVYGYDYVGGFDLATKTAWAKKDNLMFHINVETCQPMYEKRFSWISAFSCGLAETSIGYHILPNGEPAYTRRFKYIGRFFEGLAEAQDEGGYFHITTKGEDAYPQRFRQVIFFKNGLCPVFDETGWYHIRPNGRAAYKFRNFIRVAPFNKPTEALAWTIFEIQHNGRKRKVILSVKINPQGKIISKIRKGFKLAKPTLVDISLYHQRTH